MSPYGMLYVTMPVALSAEANLFMVWCAAYESFSCIWRYLFVPRSYWKLAEYLSHGVSSMFSRAKVRSDIVFVFATPLPRFAIGQLSSLYRPYVSRMFCLFDVYSCEAGRV